MLAGGAEAAVTPLVLAAFSVMGALSANNDNPSGACRPFDLNRDGFVMSEGSVILVLDEAWLVRKSDTAESPKSTTAYRSLRFTSDERVSTLPTRAQLVCALRLHDHWETSGFTR